MSAKPLPCHNCYFHKTMKIFIEDMLPGDIIVDKSYLFRNMPSLCVKIVHRKDEQKTIITWINSIEIRTESFFNCVVNCVDYEVLKDVR